MYYIKQGKIQIDLLNTMGIHYKIISKDDNNTSSFNYTGFSAVKIDKPLHKYGTVDALLKQSVEQLHTRNIKEKFVGKGGKTPS